MNLLAPSLSRIPILPYLSGRCQRFSNIGDHTVLERVQGRIRFGLGIGTRVLALLRRRPAKPARPTTLGEPSRFREGDWIRVADEAAIRATLDARSRTRGLEFSKQQWHSCGGIYRVSTVVRRIIDDGSTLRAVSRTVLLDDVDCGGADGTLGCGRHCPMMFRDEWLGPASAPALPDPTRISGLVAEVRSVDEIRQTLDPLGRREGLLFMPEMAQYAGQRYPVAHRIERVLELDTWRSVGTPAFALAGLRCTGAVLGANGPCHRRCHMLWHRDWLRFD